MSDTWRQLGSIWQLRPPRPRTLVEFIGGSYLAATPQVSYRRLLEGLVSRDIAVHAWSYIPGFDHQNQARQAGATYAEPVVSWRSAVDGFQRRCALATVWVANCISWLPMAVGAAADWSPSASTTLKRIAPFHCWGTSPHAWV